ncbi:protein of unknown function [Pararobbsia alpina]
MHHTIFSDQRLEESLGLGKIGVCANDYALSAYGRALSRKACRAMPDRASSVPGPRLPVQGVKRLIFSCCGAKSDPVH